MKTLQATLSYYHNREKSNEFMMVDNLVDAIVQAAEMDFGITLEDEENILRILKEVENTEDIKMLVSDGEGDEYALHVSWNSTDGYCLFAGEECDKYSATWVEVKDISEEISNREKELQEMSKEDLIKHILELENNS